MAIYMPTFVVSNGWPTISPAAPVITQKGKWFHLSLCQMTSEHK